MAKAMTVFDQAPPALPEDLEAFLNEESNIKPKETVPTLSYEGKNWTIGLNGEKTKLMRKNADGDDEPIAVMRVVILDHAKSRGRAFYEGAYDPEKQTLPKCWSDDGIVPAKAVRDKQAAKCAECPLSIKGSKVTEQGKEVTACSQHRMIAVIPSERLDFSPLRMKIAMTSDWDKKSPDHEAAGWFAFSNYLDFLRSREITHTARIVTKMKFDPNTAYPKVLFATDAWVKPEQLRELIPVVKSHLVKQLIDGTFTPNGIDGVAIAGKGDDEEEAPVAQPAPKPTPAPAAAKPVAPAPVVDPKAAQKAAAKAAVEKAQAALEAAQKAAAEAAAAASAGDEDEDEDEDEDAGDVVMPAPKPAVAKPAPAAQASKPAPAPTKANGKAKPAPTAVPAVLESADGDELGDLLAQWG